MENARQRREKSTKEVFREATRGGRRRRSWEEFNREQERPVRNIAADRVKVEEAQGETREYKKLGWWDTLGIGIAVIVILGVVKWLENVGVVRKEWIDTFGEVVIGVVVFGVIIVVIGIIPYFMWKEMTWAKKKQREARGNMPKQKGIIDSLFDLGDVLIKEGFNEVERQVNEFEGALEVAQSGNLSSTQIRTSLRTIDREIERASNRGIGGSSDIQPSFSTARVIIGGHTVRLGMLPVEQAYQLKDALEERLEEAGREQASIAPPKPSAKEGYSQETSAKKERIEQAQERIQTFREAKIRSLEGVEDPEERAEIERMWNAQIMKVREEIAEM